VNWKITSPRVLTTEFIDNSAKITEVEKIKQMGLSISDVNEKLLTIFGEQIFRSGWFFSQFSILQRWTMSYFRRIFFRFQDLFTRILILAISWCDELSTGKRR
jgi:ABC1 atypical kinase-like domain